MPTLEQVEETLQVRFEGETFRFPTEGLDISDTPENDEVLTVAAQALTDRLGRTVTLEGYDVQRYVDNGLIEVHPQAKFGSR